MNPRQNRALWTLFRAAGRRRGGSPRDRWLSLAAPLMVVITFVVWVLWLVGGFALLSISVTYLLAIYRELVSMQSLASDISGLFSAGEEHVLEFTRREG